MAYVFNPSFPDWSVAKSLTAFAVLFILMATVTFGKFWWDKR